MTKISKGTRNFAILTLITVLVWLGFGIYKVYFDSRIPKKYEKLAEPINLELDTRFLRVSSTEAF